MKTIRFYIAWFIMGRAYWKAQREIQKLEEDCLRWATLAAHIDGPTGSLADAMETWLAQRSEDEAA